MTQKIQSFKTVPELQRSLEVLVNTLKLRSEELSKIIGEMMRFTDPNTANKEQLQEFRQRIEGIIEAKKKKSTVKKDKRSNWYDFDSISIYGGIGIKGVLELYFKALDQTKSELERMIKVKQAVDDLVSKGLKREMRGVLLLKQFPAEIAFTPSNTSRKKFLYKAIFSVSKEEPYEIKI